jgi:hypothetical protein
MRFHSDLGDPHQGKPRFAIVGCIFEFDAQLFAEFSSDLLPRRLDQDEGARIILKFFI